MSDRLTAYIDGQRVGAFVREKTGVTFTFDDDWRESARRMELTLSMPKSRREHARQAPLNYLWNLLPDNEAVLQRWGTKFGVSPRNPMALLANVGLDAAGAIQLSVQDEPTLTGPAGLEPIGEAEIAEHIRQLRVDPEAWLLPGHNSGYFSLAGAQAKFALARTPDGGWAVPTGRAPSTHILKPGIFGLQRSDLNEHLSLRAAAHLGLRVANSSIDMFEDESVIVVERYDRTVGADGEVTRVHQEDMAQVAGIHPTGKYQNEGGPSLAQLAKLIQEARGRDRGSVHRLFEAAIFNWAALGTDAHAKNYSLLHDRANGPSLAPLYDVATALPYPDLNNRKTKLAMSFGGHYRTFEVEPRHLLADATALGLDAEWARERATEIVEGISDAYAQAAADADLSGDSSTFAAEIVDKAHERAVTLQRQLERAATAPQPVAPSAKQPRNADVGKPGNPGAFAERRNSPPRTTLT